MTMTAMRFRNVMLASLAVRGMMFAGLGVRALQPIAVVAAQADVVTLATVTSVAVGQSSRVATVTLTTTQSLKGQPGSSTLQAQVVLPTYPIQPSPQVIDTAGIEAALTASCGIWFLQLDPTGYRIIPTAAGYYSAEDLFLRQDCQSLASVPSGTLNQQLLAYVVRWYEGLDNPDQGDERLQASFQSWKPGMSVVAVADLLSGAAELTASTNLNQHAMGLVLAVQLRSDPALAQVLTEVDTLKTNPKFAYLTAAIAASQPDAGAVPALLQEVAMHTDAPGLDDAVRSALMRLTGNRAVVPAMAKLLGSQDPVAQLRAARFFSVFTFLADAHGNISEGAPDGPLATAETRSFAPGLGPTPAQCVQFWEQWWTDNATKLGFSAQ